MFDKLFQILEQITLYKKIFGGNNNRLDFPDHYGAVFGIIKPRFKSQPELSMYSRKYPKIHEEIVRIGKMISNSARHACDICRCDAQHIQDSPFFRTTCSSSMFELKIQVNSRLSCPLKLSC